MTAATTKKPPTVDPKGRCGTYAGSRAHARRGESCCDPCLDEQRAYMRRKQQERRSRPEVRAQERERSQLPEVKARQSEYAKKYRAEHLDEIRAKDRDRGPQKWEARKRKRDEWLASPEGRAETARRDRDRRSRAVVRQAVENGRDAFRMWKASPEYREIMLERKRSRERERRRRYKAKYRKVPGHPERVRKLAERNRKRYGGKVPGVPTSGTLQDRLDYYGGRCWMCGADTYEVGLHWDHVKPLSKGGADALCNLRPSCPSCNLSKGSTWPYTTPERTTP